MIWRKLGQIYTSPNFEWRNSHAQNPIAEQISESHYKIYYATRDSQNRARGGYFIYDMDSMKVVRDCDKPLFEIGRAGAFDDCGVMPGGMVDFGGERYMYYTGWSRAVVVPFTFYIGLAVSRDGGETYERYSEAPVLGRTKDDPFLTAAPWVIKEGYLWRMWYISATHWETGEGSSYKHYYRVKYAESLNGIDWQAKAVAVDFLDDEYALARPVVSATCGGYEMWFCSRGGQGTYRIKHAVSPDGIVWTRTENVGIDVSEEGWDSEMICYPYVFTHKNRKYMLYNGNNYSGTGIGLAVMEQE